MGLRVAGGRDRHSSIALMAFSAKILPPEGSCVPPPRRAAAWGELRLGAGRPAKVKGEENLAPCTGDSLRALGSAELRPLTYHEGLLRLRTAGDVAAANPVQPEGPDMVLSALLGRAVHTLERERATSPPSGFPHHPFVATAQPVQEWGGLCGTNEGAGITYSERGSRRSVFQEIAARSGRQDFSADDLGDG
jgi:hypothetical protein